MPTIIRKIYTEESEEELLEMTRKEVTDKMADSDSELQSVIFAEGFGVPTDLEIGPDRKLYVSSLRDGAVYRIAKLNKISK